MTRPLVIAHRGASVEAHENTLPAFERAIDVGADMIEVDVRRTGDGALVAFHDADVDGLAVQDLTGEEIGARTGHPPPLLDDVLALAVGRIRVNLELKEDGYVDRVLRSLGSWDTHDLLVTSFLDSVVGQVKRCRTGLAAGLLIDADAPPSDFVGRAQACRADVLGLDDRIADAGAVRNARTAGLEILVWTVNDDSELRRRLADPAVLGVVTDRPARALELRGAA